MRPDFSLWKNPVKQGKNPLPHRKNPVKYTGFSTWYSAAKRHSSLLLCTYLCRNTHVPPPFPGPARPQPVAAPIPARPAIPARPSRPAPAQLSGTCYRIFPGVGTVFFQGHTGFFPRVRKRGKYTENTGCEIQHLTSEDCAPILKYIGKRQVDKRE